MKSAAQAYVPGAMAGERTSIRSADRLSGQVGFWSALLATLLNIAFMIALIALPGPAWRGMYEFATDFRAVDLLPVLPAFLLAPTIVALFAAIHHFASPERRIFSQLGLMLAAIYAALSATNYFLQLTVVREHLLSGETAGLALFVMANPTSLMLAVDMLGYFFLFLASLCAAPVFEKGRLDVAIRWLLAASGVLGVAGVIGYILENQTLNFAGLMISGLAFLLATALMAVLFRGFEPEALEANA